MCYGTAVAFLRTHMGNLKIKDDVLGRVAAFAKTRGVPVEQQAEELLHESINRYDARIELRKTMEAIAAMTLRGARQTDSVELIREDRDR